MVKKVAAAFRAPEADEEMEMSPSPNSVQVELKNASHAATGTSPEPVPNRASSPPIYRQGKKNLSVWIDAKAFAQFKAIVALEGETLQDYMIRMLNEEFARKNRPQIAK